MNNYHVEKVDAVHYWKPEEGHWHVSLHIGMSHAPSNRFGHCVAISKACIDDFGTLVITKDWV